MFRRILLAMIFALLLLSSSRVPFVYGAGLQRTDATAEVIKVGIYLIRAGSLDISTGAIDVDFYIEFVCPTSCGDRTDFEIINGVAKSKPVLLADKDSEMNPTYRVAATVFQDVDLRKYPFDAHQVKIIVESSNYDKTEVVYKVNPVTTAIDPNVFILGWDLNHTPHAQIVDQYYEAWNQHYTRYEFTADLSKPPLAGWLKGILPAVFIALGSLFALFITPKNIGNRVTIITSALVASVLYHLNFTSRVPAIGYLTFGDTFMIINYIIILVSLALTIWIIRSENAVLVAKVNKVEIVLIPLLWAVLHILNYVMIF